jgi:hypothetical protein
MLSMTAMGTGFCTARAMFAGIARRATRRIDDPASVRSVTSGAPALGTVVPGRIAAPRRAWLLTAR